MSTSAAIGMKMEDGSVQAVGLTSEGYPEYAGAVLCGCYKTAEQVEALLALGDLSQISGTPKFCNIFDAGEEQPTRYETVDKFQRCGKCIYFAEYLYLFDNGKWSVFDLYGDDPKWADLETVVGETNK